MRKLIVVVLFVVAVMALGLFFWSHYRHLWLKRTANYYSDASTSFTFFYPKGFNLFRLEDLQRRNKDFVAGFKKVDRDSIACGIIEKPRPAGYEWDPNKELEASLKLVSEDQKGFEQKDARAIKIQYGTAIFFDYTYQYDPQTRARNQQMAFPTEDRFYYLSCGGPADVFDEYKYGFELFFKTFRVL